MQPHAWVWRPVVGAMVHANTKSRSRKHRGARGRWVWVGTRWGLRQGLRAVDYTQDEFKFMAVVQRTVGQEEVGEVMAPPVGWAGAAGLAWEKPAEKGTPHCPWPGDSVASLAASAGKQERGPRAPPSSVLP